MIRQLPCVLAILVFAGLRTDAALIQWFTATNVASVETDASGVATNWLDLSGSGNHATNGGSIIGAPLYPSTSLSASGLPGVDMGDNTNRNCFRPWSAATHDSWLDFTGAASGKSGFAVLVAFKAKSILGGIARDVLMANSGVTTAGFGLKYEQGEPTVFLGGTEYINNNSSALVAAGNTVLFTFNYDKATGNFELWESKAGTSRTGTKAAADFSRPNALLLGTSNNGDQRMDGNIFEVRVYDHVLSSSDLATARQEMAAQWVTPAATLTVQTNILGPTPDLLGYNSGHFFTNSNTKDWWRYAGVNGARVFMSPSEVEFSDDLPPVGDGVTSQAGFINRKAALRADPLNTSYINWPYFLNRYESNDLYPNNHIRISYTLGAMHQLGVKICAQITASESRLPISGPTDWGGKWELWQHYYAQAFYLGREFDVERYQMFNEPNHSNANGLTQENFLMRLQLASDAIQSALQDVNSLYGKSLTANVLAPVTAGNAESSYTGGWGELVVMNRHVNFLGQTDPAFWLVHTYDYHQYNSSPSGFGGDLATLNGLLTSAMSPEPRFPTAISEFNVHTGATFDGLTETQDSPDKYSRFGAILVQLMANRCNELYAFKFSQTEYTGNYPVAKNAMHYVDNANSPYNVGGITKAGEVYRLFNKAFAAGRNRLNTTKGSAAASFDVHASYDPVRKRYHLFSVNNTASAASINFVLSALPVPVGNRVLLEEVSESNYGGGKLWPTVPANKRIAAGPQEPNSVWLLTVPVEPQAAEQFLAATDDAEVRDGSNKNNNYGGNPSMTARNDPASTANRSAAFMKFNLGGLALTNIEFALLSFQASSATSNVTAQAHVYGLAATNWSQAAITWAGAPNLKQNVTAGNTISKQCVTGEGDTAFIVGQVVVNSTHAGEKLIDVTDWLRGRTNSAISFLVSQDPRWDVALPSLATGDTQPDGVKILTTESGNGPRLRIVLKSTSGPATLTNSFSGTTLSLSWPAEGWKLQQQTNALSKGIFTNWVYVTDGSVSSTNITVDKTKPTVFYRLVYP